MRKCGAVVDNLLSVDLVTADGRFVTASAAENQDLFWGLRGGGGNFGIATAFEYRLHPIGPILTGGLLLYPASEATSLLRFYREYMATATDDVMALVVFLSAPPAPFVPEHLHGAPMGAVGFCHTSSLEEGQQAADRFRTFSPPAVDLIGPMPYTALQQLFDPSVPFGLQVYLKSNHLGRLDDDEIDTMVTHAGGMTSPLSVVILLPFGGAIGRGGEDATAFGHRDAPYDYVIYSMWTEPGEADRHIRWTRDFAAAMQPFSVDVYVNEMGAEGEDRVRAAFNPRTYERLVALKNTYDPTNLFRLNQNIKPTV
jgi:FAD/FMN-containing dehydrogenase